MTPERWRQIKRLFQEALDLEARERPDFLEKACAGDEALRREVESLLTAREQAGSFIKDNALEVEAKHLAKEQAVQGDPLATNISPNKLPHDASTWLDPDGSQVGHQLYPLGPGELLNGRYLIEEVLGSGGFSLVFRASDKRLNGAPVAIKVLHERLQKSSDRDEFERMFRREIDALNRINHPGVVCVFDVGQTYDGRPYLVMQYIPGESLRSVLRSQRLSLERVGNLIRQIASALTAAHAQGVIHKDLKPENIILQTVGDEEYVKLIDFGIAKVLDSAGEAGIKTTTIVGTLPYMAPEQLEGKSSPASDIYALGVIAYEMVTGQLPFKAKSQVELRDLQRAGVKVKPSPLQPDLSKKKEDVILKALSFKQSDRYTSARDFGEAFTSQEFVVDGVRPLPIAVVILIALLVVFAWFHYRTNQNGSGSYSSMPLIVISPTSTPILPIDHRIAPSTTLPNPTLTPVIKTPSPAQPSEVSKKYPPLARIEAQARRALVSGEVIKGITLLEGPLCENNVCQWKVGVIFEDSGNMRQRGTVTVKAQLTNRSWKFENPVLNR